MTCRRVTISDISQDAGVSKRTVSRVLNNSPLVSEATRERVLASIRRLNYQPSIIARSLARGQNHILGVFVYEPSFPLEPPDFYYPFLTGIQVEAMACGYNLLLYTRYSVPDQPRSVYAEGVNILQVADGSVLLGIETNHADICRLQAEEYPFVYIGRRDLPGCEINYITADYIVATCRVVRYLFDRGHRRIGYLGPKRPLEPAQDRLSGFLQGVEALGLSAAWVVGLEEENVCPPALLSDFRAQGVTALVTHGADSALACLRAAESVGIRIPEDLSLAALSDPFFPELRRYPPLTYLAVPRREMGRAAVRMLVNRLQGQSNGPQSQCLSCRLVEGATVGVPHR